MGVANLFNVNKQLTFYGAYHNNKVNVAIHILCVPLLLWSAQVLQTLITTPSFFPRVHKQFGDYLTFDLNIAAVQTALYWLYYLALEPVAAILYAPQLGLSLLTATAFAEKGPQNMLNAIYLHVVCWIAQFVGHGAAEKRAPALLDNLLGAVVLAPFFVHLEMLFAVGYNKRLHRSVQNGVGVEIAKFRKAEADKKRAAGKTE